MPDWNGWVPAVDVAEYQHACNYPEMARHVHAMWAKAGQGANYRDPLYMRHRAGWGATGRPFGAYYFPEPDRTTAAQAAARFVDITDGFAGCTLPPMLDLEDRPGANMVAALGAQRVADWAFDFLTDIEEASGRTPILYIGGYFGMACDSRLSRFPNWTPNYGTTQDYATEHWPDFRPGWSPKIHCASRSLGIFQHSGGNGRVPGCGTPIDLDLIDPALWSAMTQEDIVTPEDIEAIANRTAEVLAANDKFLTAVAVKTARTVGGQSKAEGQPWAQDITNLGDGINTTLAVGLGSGTSADAITTAKATADELAKRLGNG